MQDNENSLPEENLENNDTSVDADNKAENASKTDETTSNNSNEDNLSKIKELNEIKAVLERAFKISTNELELKKIESVVMEIML